MEEFLSKTVFIQEFKIFTTFHNERSIEEALITITHTFKLACNPLPVVLFKGHPPLCNFLNLLFIQYEILTNIAQT